MPEQKNRLVKIAVAQNELEANVLKDVLSQEGITAFVRNVDPLATMGVAPSLPSSMEMYVPAADEKRARWIIGKLEPSR